MKTAIKIFVFLCMLSINAYSQTNYYIAQEWIQKYNGPDSLYDVSIDMDINQNVYITGTSETVTNSYDIVTIKYDKSGNQLWTKIYDGPTGFDRAQAIALDKNGNVYVIGNSRSNFVVIKYNSNGNEMWVNIFDGTSVLSIARDIKVDDNGNVFVTGKSDNDYVTVKYNTNGVKQWNVFFNGSGNSFDVANAIGADRFGNIYVTGLSYNSSGNSDIVTIKYNQSGVKMWSKTYNGAGNSNDAGVGLAVSTTNKICITGAKGSDYVTIMYNANGAVQWVQTYNGSANADDVPTAIITDGQENVYVTGGSVGNTGLDYATIKYNRNGQFQWLKRFDRGGIDMAKSIALDNTGNIYVTGESNNGNDMDFATVKYSSSGEELWTGIYDGKEGYDGANKVLVDRDNNIYVTGYSTGTATNYDFATIKYSQLDISNPRNPFDFVGEYHNKTLDYIINSGRIFQNDSSLYALNINKVAYEFICDNSTDINNKAIIASNKITGNNSLSCNMTNNVYNYQKNIITIIEDTTIAMKNYIDSVFTIEQKVLNSNVLSKAEKTSILVVTSVARYSMAYWVYESNNPNSKWGEVTAKDPPGWVYADLTALYGAGFWSIVFAATCPECVIASAATASVIKAGIDNGWWKKIF